MPVKSYAQSATAKAQAELNIKKQLLEWHEMQAMGTQGGEALLHEEIIGELLKEIEELKNIIKENRTYV